MYTTTHIYIQCLFLFQDTTIINAFVPRMYRRQPTHLAPEATRFNPQGGQGQDMYLWQQALGRSLNEGSPGLKIRRWLLIEIWDLNIKQLFLRDRHTIYIW